MTPTLDTIWAEFAAKLGQFIRARVADPAASEDILQDVFVKLQAKLGQLKDPAKLPSWLYLMTRNAIIDHYRAKKPMVEVPETLPAPAPETDPELDGLKAAFRRMIHSLPEPYREALVLTEFEGLTQQELAVRLGISLSGAKSRVQRARGQLRKMLLDCCRFEFDRRGQIIECESRSAAGCQECG
jgi:RNA polymerase sigma-70 factor (ECF subfamily)